MKSVPEKVYSTPEFYTYIYQRLVDAKQTGRKYAVTVCELERDDYGKLHECGEKLSSCELIGGAKEVYEWLSRSEFKPSICTYSDRPEVWLIIAIIPKVKNEA